MHRPHSNTDTLSVGCAIITVSDTRTPATDRSGKLLHTLLEEAGHQVLDYAIVKDEPIHIQARLEELKLRSEVQVLILNGGTGIAPRDRTYDAIEVLLDKTLPGFGELFRFLSFQEVGSRAMASRAIAGVYGQQLIFSLPGSVNAVKLALEQLILPELSHLVSQLNPQ